MRVLVGCECSQVVTAAFRAAGHEAFSCDIQPSYGNIPEFHFQGDLHEVFDFVKPELFIAHPPCTYLSNAGARHLYSGHVLNHDRYLLGIQAREFFMWCLSVDAPYICVENPVPSKIYNLPKPSQIIQPYYFGEPYTKRTCLWLKNLPSLYCTAIVKPIFSWCPSGSYSFTHDIRKKGMFTKDRQKMRSKTFEGVANAMVLQWGCDGVKPGTQYTFF